jgi:hypothetical protein
MMLNAVSRRAHASTSLIFGTAETLMKIDGGEQNRSEATDGS